MIAWLAASPSPTSSPTNFGSGVIGFAFALSLITWAPVVVAVVVALLPRGSRGRYERWPLAFAFWTIAFTLAVSVALYSQFQSFTVGVQFEERLLWIPSIGAAYHLGVDGVSITALMATQIVGLVAVLASWDIRERPRTYFALLLLVQASVTGAVVARDFLLLFLFWSFVTLPAALLVVGWGNSRRRPGVARMLGYWSLGSATLLAAGLLVYSATGAVTFDMALWNQSAPSSAIQVLAAALILVAAATRLPLVPLHGWIREALGDSSVGVAVLLAGSVTRLGAYLLVRLTAGVLPDGARAIAPYVGVLAAATVVYAGLAAVRSRDLRHAAAYLALVPGGITALGMAGLSPVSLHGVVLSLFAGGLAAALVVGAAATLAERAQVRGLPLATGLAARLPVPAWLLILGAFAALGLPFFATFTSGVMVFLGSFGRAPGATLAVAAGLIVAAAAVAGLAQRTLFGAPNPEAPAPQRQSLADSWYLGILVGGLLWVGLVPGGPKLFGIPLFDPGLINVVNASVPDLAAPFAPSPPPVPAPKPTPTPAPAPSPSPSASASPSPSPSTSPSASVAPSP